MTTSQKVYYGNRLVGGEAAYVLAQMRFLLDLGPRPHAVAYWAGNGANEGRKDILNGVAAALVEKAKES